MNAGSYNHVIEARTSWTSRWLAIHMVKHCTFDENVEMFLERRTFKIFFHPHEIAFRFLYAAYAHFLVLWRMCFVSFQFQCKRKADLLSLEKSLYWFGFLLYFYRTWKIYNPNHWGPLAIGVKQIRALNSKLRSIGSMQTMLERNVLKSCGRALNVLKFLKFEFVSVYQ